MRSRAIRFASPRVKKYKSCRCRQSHWHQSRMEAGYCNQLEILRRAREIRDYEIQKTFALQVNGKTIARHKVDFLVTTNKGKQQVEEVKGWESEAWIIKRKLFEALYPEIPYIVVR